MRVAIFSDVHANLEAFDAVLLFLEAQSIDNYVFVGDIVGYGADPKPCIDRLRSLVETKGCTYVAGNHDYAVCGLTKYDQYNVYARLAIEWTKEQLDKDSMQFLREMPLVQKLNGFTVVHASLDDPQDWKYVHDIDDADQTFKKMESSLCFIGHSHRPVVFTANDIVDWFIDENVKLKDGVRYLINAGSVGQPRDGNPKAALAIYDSDEGCVQIVRVDYDIESAQKKIIDAGLPTILAERLSIGK